MSDDNNTLKFQYGTTLDVTAGRVSIIDAGWEVLSVLSDPAGGNATVNPDGTLAVVLSDPDVRGPMTVRVEVKGATGIKKMLVQLNAVEGEQAAGWGTGDHYTLQTDDDDMSIIEPGENHRKIFVSGSSDALSLADIAAQEGVPVSDIDGEWLAAHPQYGSDKAAPLDAEAAGLLWYELTGRGTEPSSHWLMLERGYEYGEELGRITDRRAEGESPLHPLLVTAWGSGDAPVLATRINSYQGATKNFVIKDIAMTEGTTFLEGENIMFENIVATNKGFNIQQVDNFTLRHSSIVDAYRDESQSEGFWDGAKNKISGFFSTRTDGLLIEHVLSDHNAWADDYREDASLEGGQPPSKFSHNFYIQSDARDVTFRDNVSMQGASFALQIRPGGFVENNVFADSNAAVLVGSGTSEHLGNYSLVLDNIVTLGAHHAVDIQQGAITLGMVVQAADATLLDNIVAHLNDPDDAVGLLEKVQNDNAYNLRDTQFFENTIVYNWVTENWRGHRLKQFDQSLPAKFAPDELDDVTLSNFMEDLLGSSVSGDGISEMSAWLRANWTALNAAEDIVEYFQEGFGITVEDERTTNTTLRFVPDVLGDGVRWDNRLNWTTDDLPILGDNVDLAGNWVTYSGTSRLNNLDLGEGGVLTVRQGYLKVGGKLSSDGDSKVLVGNAGQVWLNGYSDKEVLQFDIDGGRFANLGTVSGQLEMNISGGETIFGVGGTQFRTAGTILLEGSDSKVGFDGRGGTATLAFDSGATLKFVADAEGVSEINEFRSGHWGLASPGITSVVDLGAGETTLALDLSALSGVSGNYGLISVDDLRGGFDSVSLVGNTKGQVTLSLDYGMTGDALDLTYDATVTGSGVVFEMDGSAAKDKYLLVDGVDNAITDYQSNDVIDLSGSISAADLSKVSFNLRTYADGELVLSSGGAEIELAKVAFAGDASLLRVTAGGSSRTLDLSGLVARVNTAPETGGAVQDVNANGVVTGTLQGSDPDGDALTYSLVNGPKNGLFTLNADGSFRFDPKREFDAVPKGTYATEEITYKVSDGRGGSATNTVLVRINGVSDEALAAGNAIPTAWNYSSRVDSDAILNGTLLGRDTDKDALSFSIEQAPTRGVIKLNIDGTFSFDTNDDFDDLASNKSTTERIIFSVSDGRGGVDTATLRINIDSVADAQTVTEDKTAIEKTPVSDVVIGDDVETEVVVNTAPTAVASSVSGNADALITGMLSATDPDGDTLSFLMVDGPSKGTLTIGSDGAFSYDADGAYDDLALGDTKTETVTFKVSDGNGGTDTKTLSMSILGVWEEPASSVDDQADSSNIAPHAWFRSIRGDADMVIEGEVTARDLDQDELIFSVKEGPSKGELVMDPDGSFAYDAQGAYAYLARNVTVTENVTFQVSDGNGGYDTETLAIRIVGQGDDWIGVETDLGLI